MKRIVHRKGMRIAGWALICACALAVVLRLPAALADQSDSWGSLSWKYTESNKKLTITGNGAMKAFSYDSKSAWHQDSMRDYIETVEIGSGVTTIGQGAFSNCTGLKHIVIPDSVTAIGQEAFSGCTGLKHIIIPNKKTTIGADAFKDCEDLILYHSDNPSVVQYAADNGMTAVSNGEDWSSAPAGENAWYELYSDGTLFIRGSGALYDYTRNCNDQLSPEDWETVREIVIDPRITFSFTEESFPEENKPAIRTELAELWLEEGESLDLTGCFTVDACFALDRVTLASGDEEIAAVQEETLTALAFGETELTVSAADWPALSITVPVRVEHHFENGVCTGCGAACTHTFSGGICEACGFVCPHPKENLIQGEGTSPTETEPGRTPGALCGICGTAVDDGREIPPVEEMNWLILPEDTVRVEAGAFEKGDFDAVRIPEGCAEIESRAFADCPNLKYVTAGPDTVIAPDAFAGCGSVLINRGE